MDHKVSKDMISSGMIPSGEKTQADLGRTQYGSVPSPSSLMDAYKSMYEKKEEVINEMASFKKLSGRQKRIQKTPRGGSSGSGVYDATTGGKHDSQTPGATGSVSGPGQGKPMVGKVKTYKVDPKTLKNNPTGDIQTNSFDLLAAYHAVYEHHKKDADGNTIPHEGEDIQEVMGVVTAGKAARVRAAGAAKVRAAGAAKPKTRMRMGPAPEKPSSSLMGTVSKGLSSAASAAGRADKAIAARGGLKKMGTDYLKKNKSNIKGALLGKTAAGTATRIGGAYVAGRMMGGDDSNKNNRGLVPTKGFHSYDINFGYTPEGDTISEDLFDALKSALIEEGCDEKNVMKIMASVTPDLINEVVENYKREENLNELAPLALALPALAKGAAALLAKKAVVGGALKAGGIAAKKAISGAALKGAAKAGTMAGKLKTAGGVKGLAGKGVKSMAKNPVNTALAGSMIMPQGGAPKPEVAQRAVGTGKRSAGVRTMSLDLFDVVKGQLLDEGLTEKECNDVMTTLTIDEIQEGLGKMKLLPTAALLGGTAVATQQIASRMGKKSGEESIKINKPNPIKDLIPNLKKKKEATEKSIQSM